MLPNPCQIDVPCHRK